MGRHSKFRSPAPLLGLGVLSLTLGLGLALWGGTGDRVTQASDTTLGFTTTSEPEASTISTSTEVPAADARNEGSLGVESSDGDAARKGSQEDVQQDEVDPNPENTRPGKPETGRDNDSSTTTTSAVPSATASTTSVPEVTTTTEKPPSPPPVPTSTLPQPPPVPTSTLPQPPPLPTTTLPQPPPVP